MKTIYDVIISPVMTEAAYDRFDAVVKSGQPD
jgi:hypothetical protein